MATVIPTSLPNLKVWLKADVGTFQDAARTIPATANSAGIQGWADQSGQGNHFSQATGGNKATLATNQQNGLPAVSFDGSSSYLTAANFAISNGITVVMVASVTTSSAAQNTCPVILDNCAVTPTSNNGFWMGCAFNSFFLQWQSNNAASNGPPVIEALAKNSYNTTAWAVVAMSTFADHIYLINGMKASANGYNYKDSSGTWALGATNAGAQFTTMKLGELIIYDGDMGPKSLIQLTDYLNQRWNIVANSFIGAISQNEGHYNAAGF